MNGQLIAFAAIVGLVLVGVVSSVGIIYIYGQGRDVPPALAVVSALAVREMVAVVNAFQRAQGAPVDGKDTV